MQLKEDLIVYFSNLFDSRGKDHCSKIIETAQFLLGSSKNPAISTRIN